MLAIAVTFLTGRYVATAHNDRSSAEWPPHPARLFSALVAAWAAAEELSVAGQAVLERIETFGPPQIAASDATNRAVVTHFVPVNDITVLDNQDRRIARLDDAFAKRAVATAGTAAHARAERSIAKERDVSGVVDRDGNTPPATALALLPGNRPKQGRTYPSVTPDSSTVVFRWPDAELTTVEREALDEILLGVTRLGHSSSLVSCWLVDEPQPPRYVPSTGGSIMLRDIEPGQLDALRTLHRRHQGSRPRQMPARNTPYADVTDTVPAVPVGMSSMSGELLFVTFHPEDRRLPATRVVQCAQALRGAVLAHASDARLESLSGHRADGAPTTEPHAAFVALPFVGGQHATGRLMGAAVVLPPASATDDAQRLRTVVLGALGAWLREGDDENEGTLTAGGRRLARCLRDDAGTTPPTTLSASRWSGPAMQWVTATPMALPWHPGRGGDAWSRAEESVRAACGHVGLPMPAEVIVTPAPMINGAIPAARYPAFRQGTRRGQPVARRLVHAGVTFDTPVRGPLVLGSGRFFGLGLMVPMAERLSDG